MVNVFFEIDRLHTALTDKGVDSSTVNTIVAKARQEIDALVKNYGENAIDQAVQLGAEKGSANFINQLYLDASNFEVKTESGNLDFSEPPRPMLPFLLKNAKPMKDGSGVYKVIPVGTPGNKPPMATSIIDAQRAISAERVESARSRAKAIAPAGSKINFRTATSKQDATKQWVKPAKDMDFTEDVKSINKNLRDTLDSEIRDIIEGYIGMY